jgi:hypothetical protein
MAVFGTILIRNRVKTPPPLPNLKITPLPILSSKKCKKPEVFIRGGHKNII